MSLVMIMILCPMIVIFGQVMRHFLKDSKYFYLFHLILLVLTIIISIIYSINQSGGVIWPWWLLSIYFVIPIMFSLLIDLIINGFKTKNDVDIM